jgi:hypothetical protein
LLGVRLGFLVSWFVFIGSKIVIISYTDKFITILVSLRFGIFSFYYRTQKVGNTKKIIILEGFKLI